MNEHFTNDFIIKEIVVKGNRLEISLEKDKNQFKAILKDNADLFLRTYKIGDHIICKGKIRKTKDEELLDIVYIKRYDLQQEVQTVEINSEQLIKKFDKLIESVTDEDYKTLLTEFFENKNTRALFFATPGGRNNHHNYEFGLLEHSIEVTEISIFLANYFQGVNLNLLTTAALLHDVGKIKSYESRNNKFEKTDWEKLLGHLSISMLFVSKMIPQDFDINKAMLLYHLIASHHGRLEYGSPVECKTKEAEILHYADVLSSSLKHIDSLEFSGNWSKVDELTKRSWFRS